MIFPRKIVFLFLPFVLLGFSFCEPAPAKKNDEFAGKSDSLVYLNHHDSAKYVGILTCRQCHQQIYNTFIETGMGKSFDAATRQKSSASVSSKGVYDRFLDLHYAALWKSDSLFIREFRLNEKKDTSYVRDEQVNYVIGSGQHTNSHLQTVNGYVNQMPMTWYTQKKKWDLPPGFEDGVNTRFSRKIGLECMSCHNAYPDFVMGSENKFTHLPSGIDCERCHGPGSIHVAQRSSEPMIDTARYIDYSIVNPSKLAVERQFDICQRCHLQGNAVLKEGKSFFDFKPGQVLSDYMSVFVPRYSNADETFIMASHAERLKQSPCFIKSHEKTADAGQLKPGGNSLTCITCHNPHVSVKATNTNVFNDACIRCHSDSEKKMNVNVTAAHTGVKNWNNCVSCHMPLSGASDIPHVSVHDHFIRKPLAKKELARIKQFLGLYAVNDKQPDALTRAQAYINQYEKFEQEPFYIDSALLILNKQKTDVRNFHALVQIYFIKRRYSQIISLVNAQGGKKVFETLIRTKSYDNRDAWTAYRIAEAFYAVNELQKSKDWFGKAVALAPFNLDFRNKYGSVLVALNEPEAAEREFVFVMKENPKYVAAYTNLGYLAMARGFPAEALRLYQIGLKLDPDNESLLLNLAAYYLQMRNNQSAAEVLKKIIKINPGNVAAKNALQGLTT